jgi:signal transduction histidine kinase
LPKQNHKLWMNMAFGLVAAQALAASVFPPSYPLTVFSDALPCLLIILVLLAFRENLQHPSESVRLFWLLSGAGFTLLLGSQLYWEYYDAVIRHSTPSPVLGDGLFLLGPAAVLAALALRPHAASAARDLRLRCLDFILLMLWWICLYAYFALPWQFVVRDSAKYNPAFYLLALVEHLAIVAALVVLWRRRTGDWRHFYGHLLFGFFLFAVGSLLLSIAIDRQIYYAGSFFDLPFSLSLAWFTVVAKAGANLSPVQDATQTREAKQVLQTARVAMLAMVSLPVLAIWSYFDTRMPFVVTNFRLRLTLGAMLLLGSLVFLKLHLLDRELVHLVSLTKSSVDNLKGVQARIFQSQKMAALGRLAAGAAHEISNPLTAILGYSELLAEDHALTLEERQRAEGIQQQVHRAQAAVNGMRNMGRGHAAAHPTSSEKLASS